MKERTYNGAMRDPTTGKFVRRDGTSSPRKTRKKRAPPEVEQRVLERVAGKGLRKYYHSPSRRSLNKMRQTYKVLVESMGGPDAPKIALLLAERVARLREQLEYYDAIMAEFRTRDLLVDRKHKQIRRIQEQYSQIDKQYREALTQLAAMKEQLSLEKLLDRIERLEEAGMTHYGTEHEARRRARLIEGELEAAVDAELEQDGQEGDSG